MIAAALLALVLQVTPGAEALEPAFANTLVSTYPDGRTARLWLDQGGAYRGEGRSGRRTSGVWRVQGAEICLRQRRPIPVPLTYCTPIVAGGVGTRWRARAVTGETIQVELVAGRS